MVHERIVLRHAAVVVKTDDHAVMVRHVLGRMGGKVAARGHLAVAYAQEQVAVGVEGQLAAEVAGPLRRSLEDLVDQGEAVVLEGAAHHRRGGLRSVGLGTVSDSLGVAEVDESVGREVRVDRHLHHPALAHRHHVGNAGNGIGKQRAVADDAKPTGALGDQHVAPGQERHRPRVHQPVDNRDHPVVVMHRAHDVFLCCRTRGRGDGKPRSQSGEKAGGKGKRQDVLPSRGGIVAGGVAAHMESP